MDRRRIYRSSATQQLQLLQTAVIINCNQGIRPAIRNMDFCSARHLACLVLATLSIAAATAMEVSVRLTSSRGAHGLTLYVYVNIARHCLKTRPGSGRYSMTHLFVLHNEATKCRLTKHKPYDRCNERLVIRVIYRNRARRVVMQYRRPSVAQRSVLCVCAKCLPSTLHRAANALRACLFRGAGVL